MHNKNNKQFIESLAFSLILFDSLFVYLSKQHLGFIAPVNIIVPIFLILISIRKGYLYILPPRNIVILLALCSLGFISGAAILPEYGIHRVLETMSAVTAFIIGYIYIRWNDNEKSIYTVLLLVGVVYSLVCIIALSKLYPSIFPIVVKLWAFQGQLIERPEITTDQNFQVFYLLPAIVILATPLNKYKLSIVLFIIISAFYILSALQTRSGILVIIGTVFLCLIAPLWTKTLGRKKTSILPLLFGIGIIILLPLILKYGSNILIRFTSTDFSTGLGRLHSFFYLFEHIYNPLWWVPQGNHELIELTGNKAHSNITAVFLDGGIISLISWIFIFIIPLIKLGKLFIKKKLDNISTIVFIAGSATMITQLTLNVPLMDQVWLWGGAVVAAIEKTRHDTQTNVQSEARITPNPTITNDENIDSKTKFSGVKLKK